MKKIALISVVMGLSMSMFAQNFSILDNVEIGARLVYIHPVLSVSQHVPMWVPQFDNNHVQSSNDAPLVRVEGVQGVRDYLTMEYDVKYFVKVHKRFRMGLGANYKQRRLEADYYLNGLKQGGHYSPLVYGGHSKTDQNYFALNLNLRRTLPKWNANVTLGLELSTLLNKKRYKNANYKGVLSIYYIDGVYSRVEVQSRITYDTEDFNNEPSVYLNIEKKIWKSLFVTAQVNKLLNSGYRYEITYYYDTLNLGHIAGALVEDTKYTYSIGLAWQFFGTENKKK